MSLPPREERTRWGLLVGLAVSSSHRTARTRPLQERSVTLLSMATSTRGRHPKTDGSSERAREREGERRGMREGEGLVRPGFKPTKLRRRHTPMLPSIKPEEFRKVKATAILSRSPDTARAVLTQRTPVTSVRLHLGRRDGKAT
ncbi:hypothetical protein Taro_055526 [Colocasia esculenta]|uniref:Uncharacterized protein n=1 Tax=Colocasia esculenta TaxID=4460 RepID=A0A843XRI9_COLES|nr:hypothetical protein [Colocasia esculenta]